MIFIKIFVIRLSMTDSNVMITWHVYLWSFLYNSIVLEAVTADVNKDILPIATTYSKFAYRERYTTQGVGYICSLWYNKIYLLDSLLSAKYANEQSTTENNVTRREKRIRKT